VRAASILVVDDALTALRMSYRTNPYFVERDLVWTTQAWMLREVERRKLDLLVRTEHPIESGPRRAFSADLALVTPRGSVVSLVEFKYEPSHARADVSRSKLPVVDWSAVVRDSERVQRWNVERRCSHGVAIFIDEGGYFRHRAAPPGASWHEWQGTDVAVLLTRVGG
jgi:hypothetical protein